MKSHLFCKIFTVAMGLMPSTAWAAEGHLQLATDLDGGDYFSGAMFDLVATSDIALAEIGFHTSATSAIDVSLYTREGSYEGNEMDESMWTFVDTKTVVGKGGGSVTSFPLDDPIIMVKGEKRAFYIYTDAGPFLRGSKTSDDLTSGVEAYGDDNMAVEVGVGKRRGWTGRFKSAVFDGEFKYDLFFFPTASPSKSPTLLPTALPSNVPSSPPSETPSSVPSISALPTASPTDSPTSTPSYRPSTLPSDVPSISTAPSSSPTSNPSAEPSATPTVSAKPSGTPTSSPSSLPSVSSEPSTTPTSSPSDSPSATPTAHPSVDLEPLTIRTNEFDAVEDTYIEMGSNKTFGKDAELFVDGDPTRVTLIKFDISSLNGGTEEEPITVYEAKLQLHALRDSVFGGSVSVYYNLDFDEQGADWDRDGSWADLTETHHVGDLGQVSKGETITLDILDAFRKKLPPTFSVRITSDSSDGVSYRSREGPNGASKEKFGPKAIFSFAYEPASHTKLAETFGTDSPTQSPTITKTWPDNAVPSSTSNRYFNYNRDDKSFGPDSWSQKRSTNDFARLDNLKTNQSTNKCGSGTRQSPRDVCSSNTRHSCYETHQIRRNSRGHFGLSPGLIDTPTPEIKPNCLRMTFPERRGWDHEKKEKRQYPDVPRCDFSRNGYNSGEQPMVHIDIKTKSEHKICGRRYDVELQYYHLHVYGNFEATAILGKVEDDGYNSQFQKLLDFFQDKANKDLSACKAKRRRARALFRASKASGDTVMSALEDEPIDSSFKDEAQTVEGDSSKRTGLYDKIVTRFLNILNQRELNKQFKFDFYDTELWRSEWFLAYDGSMTYPPCSEKVRWRVLDTLFTINKAQLRQLKNIQFEHVNPNTCTYDSVHHNESNHRPIQRYRGGRYYRCSRRHYPPDDERDRSGRRDGYSNRRDWTGPDELMFQTPAAGLSTT